MKKPIWIIVGVLAILVAVRIGLSMASRPSDQEQIRKALDDSIKASKEGRPGGVMDLMSNHLTYNEQDTSSAMGQVAQVIKKQRPDVTVDDETASISGDNAQITSPVDLTLEFLGQKRTFHIKDVVLKFHKEPATEWLVIPTTQWKLVEVQAPSFSPDNFYG
ncbi:MAG TPA: hypothetical protein VG944_19895 [Fimbriimonas sp.]|nr:hypothetical protein [Fimbriimonas sp.]